MDIILKYFPNLSESQKEQFTKLKPLYEEWNARINVVSRKDMDFLYERHILHSLGIAKVIQFKKGTKILDVGTGGGFPGIPLAILFPDCDFHLVDSIGKKIHVVEEVRKAVGLSNVKAEQNRAENLKEKYHFVVSRAVTRLSPFWTWIHNKFLPDSFNSLSNGLLYLKGGDLKEELSEVKKDFLVYELSNYFSEEFFETKKVVYVRAR